MRNTVLDIMVVPLIVQAIVRKSADVTIRELEKYSVSNWCRTANFKCQALCRPAYPSLEALPSFGVSFIVFHFPSSEFQGGSVCVHGMADEGAFEEGRGLMNSPQAGFIFCRHCVCLPSVLLAVLEYAF